MVTRSLVAVSAGLGTPSSTRMLADRLASATADALGERGVEAGVRSGLMYRDRGDDAALIMLDVDEAKSLVAEWNAALEDEEGGDREIEAGQALAEFVGMLAHDAQLAFGEPGE